MSVTIAILAALPAELKPLVAPKRGPRWSRLKAGKGTVLWEHQAANARWIAACSGMGADRVSVAMREVERYASPDVLCSIGWAGALSREIGAASVWNIAEIIDTRTGERFHAETAPDLDGSRWPVLATSDRVADAAEKARLAASYGARLVDMEAATVARIALARGIPFYCMKSVSDDAEARLPDLNPFLHPDGKLRMRPFLAHVAVRPHSWQALARLGRHSALAARHLAEVVRTRLEAIPLPGQADS